MIAIAAAGLLMAADARAAGEDKAAQDLRREVSRLRAEVQALRSAIAETTELERQRDANLVRALQDDAGAASWAAPSPLDAPAAGNDAADEAREAAPVPPTPQAVAAAGDDKGRAVSRRHRHKHARHSHAKATRVLTDER
jgi:hypothetical protein